MRFCLSSHILRIPGAKENRICIEVCGTGSRKFYLFVITQKFYNREPDIFHSNRIL
ncbi:hypothetical protein LEP1GSC073_1059 [Leptospira noguchii str. Cascata]|nr:hypothetical protein LEP1GSC072_0409 [Leptospira noguchii str. Bonito]EMO30007.1 hypothetical protein LEP1GSC170_2319 [Leptospira interrogans serovar Bataviae str. HAI135]EMS83574.1 hypothetical protein LEP1GSC073_1059 [Leptospira noguchii str. Cascata]